MSVPLRKDDFDDEEITTADLAQSRRPVVEDRAGPVLAGRSSLERPSLERSEAEQEGRADESVRTDAVRSGVPTKNVADATPLFASGELDELRNQWNEVQAAFVDEPRRAVEQADGLVASAMKRLAEVFAEERSKLEQQWDRGDNISTEDLRVALQRYRSFFHRLLSV
jgi:hypothetical protein